MKLWFVGRSLIVDGVEIGWMPEGVFLDEVAAAEAAKDDEFILLADVGKRLPQEAVDAEKMYWPRHESWEQSTLYKMRNSGEMRC